MENKEAKELLIKYKVGICTDEEIAILESWYLNFEDEVLGIIPEEVTDVKARIWIGLPVHSRTGKTAKLWPRVVVAASVFICMAIGLVFYQNRRTKVVEDALAITSIVPGGNKAVLTLADGSKVALNDVAKGKLISQPGLTITKTEDGQVVYTASDGKVNGETEFNTIETPRGGQYQITLPDGTNVWLNASSSLKYPMTFAAHERKLTLRGEAYFEVTPLKSRPFKVVSDNQTITVLGTHFNVSAYEDDGRITTTLLEGRVKVQFHEIDVHTELSPGEQSIMEGRSFKVRKVSNDDAIAWKNNSFVFDNEELGSIMRKISRWYDVDVVCPPNMSKMIFAGTVSRSKSIKQALRIMELTGTVQFKFEGRRITVMP